tara:strand:- start:7162 stop:8430 length:1269 start_codon:yes stop_codon:yes gene_type:complete
LNAKLFSAFIKFLSIILGFFSNFYLASLLSKNDFGLYSVIVSLLSVCLVFSNMGLSLSVVDLFPKAQTIANLKLLRRKIWFYSVCSSVVVGCFAALYAILTGLISSEKILLLVVLVLIVLFQNIHSSNIAILRSLQSFRVALSIESIAFNVVLVLSIYLLFSENVAELFISFLLAAFLAFGLSSLCSYYKVAKFPLSIIEKKEDQPLELNLAKLWPFILLGLVEVVSTNLDVLLVRELYGNEETANYFLAKKMLIVFTFFWFIYNFIYTPKLSKLFVNSEKINHADVVSILRLKWPVLMASTCCMVVANMFFEDIILLFNFNDYLDAKPYILLFSLFAFIHILTGPVVSFLNVTGLSSYSFRVVSFGAFVFLSTFYPLQSYFGVLGILIALNLSLLAWKLLGVYIIRKATGFNLIVGSYIDE